MTSLPSTTASFGSLRVSSWLSDPLHFPRLPLSPSQRGSRPRSLSWARQRSKQGDASSLHIIQRQLPCNVASASRRSIDFVELEGQNHETDGRQESPLPMKLPMPHAAAESMVAEESASKSTEGWKVRSMFSLPVILGATLLGVSGGGVFGTGFDMSGPESVLEAIAVLAAVVGVHEAGHFFAARLQGIHVTKFAIGFGPPLLRFSSGGIEYSLRVFPLGGYVQFPDDDPESPFEPDDPNLLRNRPVWDRIIVTSAGVIANCVFALSVCYAQAVTVGISEPDFLPGVKLGVIYPDTVASRAGLQRGDIILNVEDMKVAPSVKSVESVVNKIAQSPGKSLRVHLDRMGKELDINVTPAEMPDGSGRIGVSLGPNVKVTQRKAGNPIEGIYLAGREFMDISSSVVRGLGQILFNFKESARSVSGPVAILAVGSEVARTDVTGLFRFAALINVNLAVVNVLPLPALDGEFVSDQKRERERDHTSR